MAADRRDVPLGRRPVRRPQRTSAVRPRSAASRYLLFVDADGIVTFVQPGEVESEQELVDLVEQHLGVRL